MIIAYFRRTLKLRINAVGMYSALERVKALKAEKLPLLARP
jgi:hypothetical protein